MSGRVIDLAAAERLLQTRVAEGRLSERRLAHSRRVAAEAAELARLHGGDPSAAHLAGILHDYSRDLPASELLSAARRWGIEVGAVEARRPGGLLHGPVAAAELAAGGLAPEVARAIALHTVGAAGMNVLERCLYVADFCEPGREFAAAVEVRAVARASLSDAVAEASRFSLLEVIERGRGVVPAALALYNEGHAGT